MLGLIVMRFQTFKQLIIIQTLQLKQPQTEAITVVLWCLFSEIYAVLLFFSD
jgi:hypothetical protein